jgi:hypothetical protein
MDNIGIKIIVSIIILIMAVGISDLFEGFYEKLKERFKQ